MYETGGMRRTHLRKRNNILKRLLFHAVGFNLALLLRQRYGLGKPRTLQGASDAILLLNLVMACFGRPRWNQPNSITLPSTPAPLPPVFRQTEFSGLLPQAARCNSLVICLISTLMNSCPRDST